MISSLSWVPRNLLSSKPALYCPTEEHIRDVMAVKAQSLDSDKQRDETPVLTGTQLEKDEYLKAFDDNDPEQYDNFTIDPTDNMLLCARSDMNGFVDCLVYNPPAEDFYFHHNLMLSDIPLCVVFLDFRPAGNGASGAYAAVGTFSSDIEIWDLNVLDVVSPVATLGGMMPAPHTQKAFRMLNGKKIKQQGGVGQRHMVPIPGSHTDAVLSLAWSPLHRNILASSSADCTIKAWDLQTQSCISTCSSVHAGGPINSIAFHPSTPGLLASTCLGDRRVLLTNLSDPRETSIDLLEQSAQKILESDPETLGWISSDYLLITTEAGFAHVIDVRSRAIVASLQPLKGLSLPRTPLSGLACHPSLTGLIAVGSPEAKKLALLHFDISKRVLQLVTDYELSFPVFSLSWCGSTDSFALAVGGSGGMVSIIQALQLVDRSILNSLFGCEVSVPSLQHMSLSVQDDQGGEED